MVHFAFLDSAGQEIASHDESLKASRALGNLYAAKARNYIESTNIDHSRIATIIVTDEDFEMNIGPVSSVDPK